MTQLCKCGHEENSHGHGEIGMGFHCLKIRCPCKKFTPQATMIINRKYITPQTPQKTSSKTQSSNVNSAETSDSEHFCNKCNHNKEEHERSFYDK